MVVYMEILLSRHRFITRQPPRWKGETERNYFTLDMVSNIPLSYFKILAKISYKRKRNSFLGFISLCKLFHIFTVLELLIGILRKQIKPGFRGEWDCFDYTIEKGCRADKLFPVRELYYSKPSSKFTIRRS